MGDSGLVPGSSPGGNARSAQPVPSGRAARRPARGRGHARFALVAAVLTAAAVGAATFLVLDAIDLSSLDPLGAPLFWLQVTALLLLLALLVVVVAAVAVVRCRPRGTAVAALLASLVLPVAAVIGAVAVGVPVAKSRAIVAVTSDSRVVGRALDVLVSWNVPTGPLRDLLNQIAPTTVR